MNKLSVSLGLRDKVEKNYANMLDDMFRKFKTQQGIFKGERHTYDALEGFADEPTKRKYTAVDSTVEEQIEWFSKETRDYFKIIFSIEKTNAQGVYANLVVDGEDWGRYSTLELLRLKSILDGKIKDMLKEMPVRSGAIIWAKSTHANDTGRKVFESQLVEGFSTTTIKDMKVVNDPHIKEAPGRAPVVQPVDTKVNVGKYSTQMYSGELSLKERAEMITRLDKVQRAVVGALAEANNSDTIESDLGDKVLDYVFK